MVFLLPCQSTWHPCCAHATGDHIYPALTFSLRTKLWQMDRLKIKNDFKHFTSDQFFKGFRFQN